MDPVPAALTQAQLDRIATNKAAAKQRRAIKKANLTVEMATNIAAKRQAARYRKAAKAAQLAGMRPLDLHCLVSCPTKAPPSTTPQIGRKSDTDSNTTRLHTYGPPPAPSPPPDSSTLWPDDKSLSMADDLAPASRPVGH